MNPRNPTRPMLSLAFIATSICLPFWSRPVPAAERPNVLWITCEDISPNLRCYGDEYAVTPNLDRLAAQGVRYTRAFAPIGVCACAVELVSGDVCPIGRIATHAMRGHDSWQHSRLSMVPPQVGLLLHEQLQDRLQPEARPGVLGRVKPQGPLAQSRRRPALLRDLQPHQHSRKPDSPERQGSRKPHTRLHGRREARPSPGDPAALSS